MFRTVLTETLGIQYPIIQAGMGGVATAELTASVSNAGGLGTLGAAMFSPDQLRDQIRKVKDKTDKPFAVDLLLAEGMPGVPQMMETMFEEGVPVFASGLGNPKEWAPEMHRRGMKVIAVVGNVKNARRVAEGGADVVVAQGHEGGGHTGRIGRPARRARGGEAGGGRGRHRRGARAGGGPGPGSVRHLGGHPLRRHPRGLRPSQL